MVAESTRIAWCPDRTRIITWTLAFLGTLVIAASLSWGILDLKRHTLEDARSQAELAYNKDLMYRRWSASYGGVYVPVNNTTQPIELLSNVPERDVSTPSGRLLTLINPACMTRLVHEMARRDYGILGHLTSIKPLRPENGPDSWEKTGLEKFETGATEAWSVENLDGQSYFRFMRPLAVEKSCLKCHAGQGYHLGDVRGGISISLPMDPFLDHQRRDILWLAIAHVFLLVIGLNALFLGARKLSSSEHLREQALSELKKAHDELEERIRERTAELEEVNETLVEEIGERRRVEDALRTSEATLRGLLKAAPIGIGMISRQELGWTNDGVSAITGYSCGELMGMNVKALSADGALQGAGLEKQAEIGENGKGIVETRMKHKNGSLIDVLLSSASIGASDDSNSFVFTMMDITQRKRAEEERIKLATAIEQAAESIIITDRNGSIEYVNPAFEQTSGYRREEIIHQNFRMLTGHEKDEASHDAMWQTISGGSMWKGRISNRVKNGTIREFEMTISPIRGSSGAITSFVSVNRDVTREVRLREQLRQAQKMEAIGTLAGGIAHDFNNILGIIMGCTEVAMLKSGDGPPIGGYLEDVLKASHRAKELVNQILTFSRQTEHELVRIEPARVVKEALKMLRASLPSTIEIRQGLIDDSLILADPTQIHQVLMNLCTNSAHAMKEQGGVLDISLARVWLDADFTALHPGLHPGNFLRLRVSDTGQGIDLAISDRIFEPYFTTKEKGEGTGLGLAVVHGIVKKHGGAITVTSEPGCGATFNVFFPVLESGALPEKTAMASPCSGKGRILFVDDEQMLCDVSSAMLKSLGYEVVAKRGSLDALEAFRSTPNDFELVITDLTMPKKTGVDLAKDILGIRPDIPIILCTGFSEMISPGHIKDSGFRGILRKPVGLRDLAETIRKAMDCRGESVSIPLTD